jgi:hypothetical protein
MKTIEILAFRGAQALIVVLGSTIIVAITYAIVQICLGNYHSTACREF